MFTQFKADGLNLYQRHLNVFWHVTRLKPREDTSARIQILLPVASRLKVAVCTYWSSGSCLLPPCGATRVPSRLVQLLTKTADYWTKIKHLPTNLWTGSQTTERTAILRSLFSCLLLWFDWAGEPCLVPPKSAEPGSNKPQYLSVAVWLAEAGRFNLPTIPPSLLGAAA